MPGHAGTDSGPLDILGLLLQPFRELVVDAWPYQD